jgi:hypothetical protein
VSDPFGVGGTVLVGAPLFGEPTPAYLFDLS